MGHERTVYPPKGKQWDGKPLKTELGPTIPEPPPQNEHYVESKRLDDLVKPRTKTTWDDKPIAKN